MQQSGSFIELVDETLGSEVNIEDAETMVKVALFKILALHLYLRTAVMR